MTSLREALRSSALVRDTRPSLENVIYAIYGADRKKTSLVFNCLTIDDRNSPLSSIAKAWDSRVQHVIYGIYVRQKRWICLVINHLAIDDRNWLGAESPHLKLEPVEQPPRSRLRRDRQKRREIGGAVDVEPDARQLNNAWL